VSGVLDRIVESRKTSTAFTRSSRRGGIGRRARFKIAFPRKYGFDSHRRYSLDNQRVRALFGIFESRSGSPELPLKCTQMQGLRATNGQQFCGAVEQNIESPVWYLRQKQRGQFFSFALHLRSFAQNVPEGSAEVIVPKTLGAFLMPQKFPSLCIVGGNNKNHGNFALSGIFGGIFAQFWKGGSFSEYFFESVEIPVVWRFRAFGGSNFP
jgi:hypothetical protein